MTDPMPQLAPKERCTGCGACFNGCPKGAIHMQADAEGFLYPTIGTGCVQCGHCSHVCPILRQREKRSEPAVFAVWNEDAEVRRRSTAGGVFTPLAQYVLESGGVVFGAAMDENLHLQHIAVKNTEELHRLQGAKLVQSRIGESYQQVRMYLDQGRRVLFSGTPCQVDGLYHYLGEHPENLLTCDFVCRGVSSPGLWEKLMHSMAYIKQKNPKAVQFCAKLAGEKERRFRVFFEGGSTYDAPLPKSEFGRGIYRALSLRPACHSCPYAGTDHPADLTMGIFTGLPKDFYPEEQREGISLLLINTAKGAQIFDTLPLKRQSRTLEEAVAGNPSLSAPMEVSENRTNFFAALEQLPFQQVRNRFLSLRAYQNEKATDRLRALIKERSWKKR